MEHKEYKLTVKEEIAERNNEISEVVYKIGDTIIVNETDLNTIKKGWSVNRYTNRGLISFNKANFENQIAVTVITTEHSVEGF